MKRTLLGLVLALSGLVGCAPAAAPCEIPDAGQVPVDDGGPLAQTDAGQPVDGSAALDGTISAVTACLILFNVVADLDAQGFCGFPECPWEAPNDSVRCDPAKFEACWREVEAANDCNNLHIAYAACDAAACR